MTDDARREAEAIVNSARIAQGQAVSESALIDAIAQALTRRPSEGHVIDDKGVERLRIAAGNAANVLLSYEHIERLLLWVDDLPWGKRPNGVSSHHPPFFGMVVLMKRARQDLFDALGVPIQVDPRSAAESALAAQEPRE